MPTSAIKDIEVKADCGAKGVIPQGQDSVMIDTEYGPGKRPCDGCLFVCTADGMRATLDGSNHNSNSLCLENDAPITR